MANADSPNGIDSPSTHGTICGELTINTIDLAHDFFDFSNEPFNEDESSPDHQIFQDNTAPEMDYSIDFSSPMFNPINGMASGQRSELPTTVSPKDVFIDSNPSSSVTTNMTTPASLLNDTPLSQYLDSPAYSNTDSPWGDNLDMENHTFPSLFPADNTGFDDDVFSQQTVHQSVEPMGPPRMTRIRSSPDSSTSLGATHSRHSSIAGVRARKRNQPLPEVFPKEPDDPVAVKRARNTMAARKSREKKVQRLEELAATVDTLMQDKAELEQQVTYWRGLAQGHRPQFGQ